MSSPKAPEAPPAPPPPPPPPPVDSTNIESPESKQAIKNNEKRARLAKGLGATIITGALGDQSEAQTQKAQVLGQSGSK